MARVWATCVAEINQTGVDERGLGRKRAHGGFGVGGRCSVAGGGCMQR